MEGTALLIELVRIARSAGIEVRELAPGRSGEGEVPARSGSCRVQGRLWALLAEGDSVEDRIEALVGALASLDPDWLDAHYLPPAVRARLEALRSRPP